MQRVVRSLLAIALSCIGASLCGCSDRVEIPPRPGNQPPQTQLTFAPVDSDTVSYRVHLYWYGTDKDGEVIRYHFAMDADTLAPESKWKATTAKDSTLVLAVDPLTATLRHVVEVAAEDNDHNIDPTPARRTFSARTIPPTSMIFKGPSAFNPLVGPNFTFVMTGTDPDGGMTVGPGRVENFEYLLLKPNTYGDPANSAGHQPLPIFQQDTYVTLINQATGDRLPTPYDDWKWVSIHGDTQAFRNVGPGEYVFAERAVDPEGAQERNLKYITNIHHFTVVASPPLPPGPWLNLKSSAALLGYLPPANEAVDKPRDPIEILEGETLSFSWQASAGGDGATILGYTYALDDTSQFPPLDLARTGATFTANQLAQGHHWLYVRVADDMGLVTNAVIPILSIRPAFREPGAERQILYVDDSQAPGGVQARIGNFPSDAEETDWWETVLPRVGVPYTEWDTYLAGLDDVLGRKPPKLSDLANYSTVIWNVDFNNGVASPTALWKTLVGGPYADLYRYLSSGGTLILTGFSIGSSTTDPRTTMYTNGTTGICATLPSGTGVYILSYFPRDLMGVDGMVSGSAAALRTLGARDFVAAYPTATGQSMGFDSASVDTGPTGSAAKWITYTAGDLNTNSSPGLPSVDGWVMATDFGCQELASKGFRVEDPSRPVADPIYRYHGARIGIAMDGGPSPREGYVVGVRVQAHDLGQTGAGVISSGNSSGTIGRTVHLGFPLYFLRDDDAKRLLQAAFNYVNASPTLP